MKTVAGWVVGMVLMVLAAVGTWFGLHLLYKSQSTVGIAPSSFYIVAQAAIPQITVVIDFIIALYTFGVGIAYLIVIGDNMPQVCTCNPANLDG